MRERERYREKGRDRQKGREGIKREDEGEKGIVENGLGIPGQHKLRGSLRSERERGYNVRG